jgi:hypothetical protein
MDAKFITNYGQGARQRLVGSGIGLAPEHERYREFGRYVLYMPSLLRGELYILHKSRKALNDFPKKLVSSKFCDLILELVDNGILNKQIYNQLSTDEQEYFLNVARRCQFESTLGLGNQIYKYTPKEEEEIKRFELLKGTVIAGNNDPDVINELKRYVVKFIHKGQISKGFGHSLLYEMACLA